MRSDFKVWIIFSISDVYVRELQHLIFDAGSVVYNKKLQEQILRHLKGV